MMRVHAPDKNCCKSRQPDSSRFAPRGFASRAEDKEKVGEHKPFPLDFDMMSLPLYPPVQAKLADGNSEGGQENAEPEDSQQEPNRTGMPDRLKAGIEALSGFDMSDVRVHYSSPKPAGLNALAYTQGNQIYMGPGQERHLSHEAWHAVQQKQGGVRATGKIKGVGMNDDTRLEREADSMGGIAQAIKLKCPISDTSEQNICVNRAPRKLPNKSKVGRSSLHSRNQSNHRVESCWIQNKKEPNSTNGIIQLGRGQGSRFKHLTGKPASTATTIASGITTATIVLKHNGQEVERSEGTSGGEFQAPEWIMERINRVQGSKKQEALKHRKDAEIQALGAITNRAESDRIWNNPNQWAINVTASVPICKWCRGHLGAWCDYYNALWENQPVTTQ